MKHLYMVHTKLLGYFYSVAISEAQAAESVRTMLDEIGYGLKEYHQVTGVRLITSQVVVSPEDTAQARISIAANETRLVISKNRIK